MDYKDGELFSISLRIFLLLLYCLLAEAGNEMVRLQKVEETTVTLHTGITGIQRDIRIQWFYVHEKAKEEILFSHMFKGETVIEISERFKERLHLNRTNGDLTIRSINRNDSGLYLVQVLTKPLSEKTFSIRVYAPVSAPVITPEDQIVSSTGQCVLRCSVNNGEEVRVSWYRENERISITNSTNLSVPLNLTLHLYHPQNDSNTYSCESQNPVSLNKTILNISQLCSYSSGESNRSRLLTPVLISSGISAVSIILVVSLFIQQKRKKQHVSEEPDDLTYADVTKTHTAERIKQDEICRRQHVEAEPVVYSDVKLCR